MLDSRCSCSRGTLASDGKTCNFTGYVMVATGNEIQFVHEKLDNFKDEVRFVIVKAGP